MVRGKKLVSSLFRMISKGVIFSLVLSIFIYFLVSTISHQDSGWAKSFAPSSSLQGQLWISVSNLDEGHEFRYVLPDALVSKNYQAKTLEIEKSENSNSWVRSKRFQRKFNEYWYPLKRKDDYKRILDLNIESLQKNYWTTFENESVQNLALSPNSRFVAYLNPSYNKITKEHYRKLVIRELSSKKIIVNFKSKELIHSFSWDPNSENIAIVSVLNQGSWWPWDLLFSILTGYGAQYGSFFLTIVDLNGQEIFHQKVVDGIKNSHGFVIWLNE